MFILKKKIFSRTSWQISIKFGTNHPCVKEIQNCTGPLQRGDNHKNAKMGCDHLETFSRTTGPE
jgi:hypothetical protein